MYYYGENGGARGTQWGDTHNFGQQMSVQQTTCNYMCEDTTKMNRKFFCEDVK
jgi:hypothetical protein